MLGFFGGGDRRKQNGFEAGIVVVVVVVGLGDSYPKCFCGKPRGSCVFFGGGLLTLGADCFMDHLVRSVFQPLDKICSLKNKNG